MQINTCDGPSAPLLQAYFDALADPGIPLLMWWNPAGWIGMMPRDVLKAFCGLARRPDIIGMKNDGDAFYDYKNLIRGTADADFAVVSGGLMQNMLYGYPLGSPAYLCPIAPFRPDIANQFYQHLVQGELTAAQRVIDDYEEPLMTLAADVEWLSLMKTAIMMRGLYPNNRVGNPTRSGIEGKELERVEGFYRELFQLERV